MFADLMSKIACRTYAILFFFYGVFGIGCGAVGFYWSANGIPPSAAAEIEATMSMSETMQFLPWLSAGFLVFGIACIALGVFAWLRYVSVMIAGCVLWIFMFGRSMIQGAGAFDTDAFAVINGTIFILLTIVAAIAARRSRSALVSPTPSA